jgi:hypothetical protein
MRKLVLAHLATRVILLQTNNKKKKKKKKKKIICGARSNEIDNLPLHHTLQDSRQGS